MAYEKQNFTDGQVLNAEHLNKMEKGIANISKILTRTGSDTLNWKAVTEDTADPSLVVGPFYKISDAVVTLGDLANGGHISIPVEGGEVDFPADACEEIAPGIVVISGIFIGVEEDNAVLTGETEEDTLVFPTAGLYVYTVYAMSDMTVTINGYTGFCEEKIDPKYLHGGGVLYTDETYLYKDIGLTRKIPYSELPDTTDFEIALATGEGQVFYYMKPYLVTSQVYSSLIGVGAALTHNLDGEVMLLYTAEYQMPET